MTKAPIDERGVPSGPQDSARPAPATTAPSGRKNLLRRAIDRLTATSEQVEAQELAEQTIDRGSTPVLSCTSGGRVRVSGTIRALRLRPVGGVQALEADLFDGSGTLTVIWLGRRRIPGIDAGRSICVHGRLTRQGGRAVMFNPAYELRS
jgi:hypothetical protein